MSLKREKIEHLEYRFKKESKKPWKIKSHSRKGLKKARNKIIRMTNKDEIPNTREYDGWEY